MNQKKNAEGYADPTPYDALFRTSASRQLDIDDARSMEEALKAAKRLFSLAGFAVVGRIRLRNERTGKVYE